MNRIALKPRHARSMIAAVAALALALAACEPRIDTHGFMPNAELVAQIEIGAQGKLEVAQVLGTPSTVATFDENIWYYITQQSRTFAFFKPEIVDQRVLVVTFGDDELVSAIDTYTIEDGLIIDPVTRTTPTSGKQLTLVQQLFGNIGRFTK